MEEIMVKLMSMILLKAAPLLSSQINKNEFLLLIGSLHMSTLLGQKITQLGGTILDRENRLSKKRNTRMKFVD